MRISTKGRYGLAAMIALAKHSSTKSISIASISNELGLSKLYLEQVVAVLKNRGLVKSVKGSQGGYTLADATKNISVKSILYALEPAFSEKTGNSCEDSSINLILHQLVFDPITDVMGDKLDQIHLSDLMEALEDLQPDSIMFYI